MIRALERIEWSEQPRSYVHGGGFCVGATQDPTGQAKVAHAYIEAKREAMLIINRYLTTLKLAGFRWTSLQFNRNTISDPHTDKNNLGLSVIILLGNYSGGSLCVPSRKLRTQPGISGVGVVIDGCETHHTEPFEGTRYSIVAFTHNSIHRLNEEHVE